jgi:DNA-binding NarL/FixJ family response regulator
VERRPIRGPRLAKSPGRREPRQRRKQVLALLARGLRATEIAMELNAKKGTIDKDLTIIYRAHAVKGRRQLLSKLRTGVPRATAA